MFPSDDIVIRPLSLSASGHPKPRAKRNQGSLPSMFTQASPFRRSVPLVVQNAR
ncbi:hypothetical protein M404DRAFT_1008761 [Pisolithus tinctorius Marx 270]|uniref:Uncharacterized protein n=1 Tax=Pisolithus tinctorius Marx 270 TaxID=870435 RepID=A0A0C3NDY4_PISTI|nr:hypothetical protein M404DRAFT_1008761 [Pisolithus tinctorius Marx 270]